MGSSFDDEPPASRESSGSSEVPVDGPSVDPRMRDRWVSVRREEGRRRLRIFVAVVSVLSVVGLGYIVANSSLLGVDHIRVRGTAEVSAATVEQAARIESGEPLLFLDTDAVEARIEAIPGIATATVDTELPTTVVITVTERRPLGWAQAAGGGPVAVLDGTGRVLRRVTEPPPLTHVVGAGALAAPGARMATGLMRALAELPPELQLRAESIQNLDGVVTLGLRGDPPEAGEVRFGPDRGMAEKGDVATAILEDLRTRGQRVGVVDVSVPGAPVTR